nr:hypothetical protein [Tanacetum cinerariifolium]
MALTFADTHNMIVYLTKSDASEGFEQILDFLNASVIQYALMVYLTVYVSCIKQFWSSVSIKKTNEVVRLQALIDKRKRIITIGQALYLDDAESVDCFPNEEIFAEWARMGYEKPFTKLTFYKAFFSAQWKFLIHTILECMSAKRTARNELSSSMALAVICLATGRKFNFSKYIFDSLVRNVDSSSKFYMYPRFLQLMIAAQVVDLSSHTTKYTSPALTQKVFANMRRVGKGFFGVDTPLFEGMLVPQQDSNDVADVVADDVATDDVDAKPTPPSPKPITTPPPPQQKVAFTPPPSPHQSLIAQPLSPPPQQQPSQPSHDAGILMDLLYTLLETYTTLTRKCYKKKKGVVIRDPKETTTRSTIVHSELKSKDKGKCILVEEPKPLKKQAQIEQDEAYARELEAELNKNINWDDVIEHVKMKEKEDNAFLRYQALKRKPQTEAHAIKNMMHFNSIVGFLEKGEDTLEEEASKALKMKNDVYIEATPLALKVPVVDYQIHTENNKPYYKIIIADGTHQLFLSFLSLLKNFDREDLEMLWQIVQGKFASSKPKNFSDDFLLNILKAMFEKPDVEAHIWKNQRGSYGLAKVKSWKLLESCGVHIITFTTTQMILLVERRYPLIRFTLDQMLNNVRLEVKKESEVSLELLRFVRRFSFGVDAVEDFKEYTLMDYYCWLKTYCC